MSSKSLPRSVDDNRHDSPERAAKHLCRGFVLHDEGGYEQAVDAFAVADKIWFDVDEETARRSAQAYVDALRAKDEIEEQVANQKQLAYTDWSPVYDALRTRGVTLDINQTYAHFTKQAWKHHKTGDDYWAYILKAQQLVVQAAVGDDDYPHKDSDGLNGYGPEPTLYLVGVECHDCHDSERWEQAVRVMTEYFQQIIRLRGDDDET